MAASEVQVATTFDSFYESRYRDAVRLAYVITADASAAEDVAQDALLRVRPRFEALRDPWPYARAAVVNGARSHLRRRKREQVRLRAAADAQPTASSSHPLELLAAIDRLRSARRPSSSSGTTRTSRSARSQRCSGAGPAR